MGTFPGGVLDRELVLGGGVGPITLSNCLCTQLPQTHLLRFLSLIGGKRQY